MQTVFSLSGGLENKKRLREVESRKLKVGRKKSRNRLTRVVALGKEVVYAVGAKHRLCCMGRSHLFTEAVKHPSEFCNLLKDCRGLWRGYITEIAADHNKIFSFSQRSFGNIENLPQSWLPVRLEPSAMFVETERAARRN
jgi:hypothetical protein